MLTIVFERLKVVEIDVPGAVSYTEKCAGQMFFPTLHGIMCVFVTSGSDEITPGNVSLLHVCESRTVTRFTEFEKLA